MRKSRKIAVQKTAIGRSKLHIVIAVTFLLWISFLFVFLKNTSVNTSEFRDLHGDMKTEITYADGSKARFEDGDFGKLSSGDVARIHMVIPEDQVIKNGELYLPIPHSIVNVYVDGRQIYRDDYDPDDVISHYGNRIYEVMLPDGYGGKDITVELISVVGMSYDDLEGVGLIPANEGRTRIMHENSFTFLISLTMIVISLFGVFLFSMQSLMAGKVMVGLPIACFEFLIATWFFGGMRFFYLFTGNSEVSAKAEYFALYLAPIPLAFFICMVVDSRLFKRLIRVLAGIYILYYIGATAVELSRIQINYSNMLATMHPIALVVLVVLILALFFGIREKRKQHVFILRYGILIAIFCGVAEVIRYNVGKYLLNRAWITSFSLSSLAMVVIAASLIVYLVSYSAEEYTEQIERNQLLELAYRDPLTGMPNRHACYSSIEEMDEEGINEYTMVFFDLNNLKLANDTYGHEMGDHLLKVAAGLIKEIFSYRGFCARWGGDEFVACVYGNLDLAKEKLERFEQEMKKEDAAGEFPFPFSVAMGYAYSNQESPLDPLDAIRQADAFMYENKLRMKAERRKQFQ